MEVYACRALILAHSFPLTTCSSFYILLGFSWSVFNQQKFVRGKGSQIFGFVLGGSCRAGCRVRGRLMFSWWHVWVSVRRFLDSLWGAAGFFNVMMHLFFVFAAALLHKVDLVMLSMQKMKFTV